MIRVGLERLLHDEAYQDLTQGRAVGLLVNPTSVDVRLRHPCDDASSRSSLKESPKMMIVMFFRRRET